MAQTSTGDTGAGAFSSTCTSFQFLLLAIGLHSWIETRSPSLHSSFGSCAFQRVERFTFLPFIGCLTLRSTSTVMVLSILLLTTRPTTTLGFFSSLMTWPAGASTY